MSDGQLAMNTNLVSPGLFLKDSNGDLVKVGPVHVGTTAPNATPGVGGQAGNSKGEQWLDTSSSRYVFKIWDGTDWRTEDGEFVNTSGDTMTGALGIIAGTAAAPSVFFSGDPNTGIFSPGADQVAISTNGTGRLTVSTTAVSSTLAVGHPLGAVGTPSITFTGDLNTGIFSPAADTIAFVEGGAEAMRLNSTGRLGLGTSSPFSLLYVSETNTTTPSLTWQTQAGQTFRNSNVELTFGVSGSSPFPCYMQARDSASAARSLVINPLGGGVGIGTSSPSAQFHTVGSTSAPSLTFNNSAVSTFGAGSIQAALGVSDSAPFPVYLQARDNINGSRNLLLNPLGGNVGIGTTSTDALLTVNGIGAFGAGAVTTPSIAATGDLNTGFWFPAADTIAASTAGSECARIDSSGRLLVGTSTALETKTQANNALAPSQQGAANTIAGSSQGLFFYGTTGVARGNLIFSRSNSATVGSHTVIGGNAHMGGLIFTGSDGTSFVPGAEIFAASDGTPGADVMPGRLVFSTTADGAATPTERMRLTNSGALLVGTTATPTGAGSGAVVAQTRTVIGSTGAGSNQVYAGEIGSITATTGTVVFKFKTTQTATPRACFARLAISNRNGNNTPSNQPAAEYAFQLHQTSGTVCTLNGATSIFEFTYVRATHFAFADLGGGECTVTLTNPTALASTGAYRVELVSPAGFWTLDSVTAT
jgi:hypothetical protein